MTDNLRMNLQEVCEFYMPYHLLLWKKEDFQCEKQMKKNNGNKLKFQYFDRNFIQWKEDFEVWRILLSLSPYHAGNFIHFHFVRLKSKFSFTAINAWGTLIYLHQFIQMILINRPHLEIVKAILALTFEKFRLKCQI